MTIAMTIRVWFRVFISLAFLIGQSVGCMCRTPSGDGIPTPRVVKFCLFAIMQTIGRVAVMITFFMAIIV